MSVPVAVGKTALLIAAARAIESKRPANERLFNDPYAAALCGGDGEAFLKEYESHQSGAHKLFALRTRYIDDVIISAVERGISQIVLLGCGMDTRPLRLTTLPPSVSFFEVDFPDVIDYKENILRPILASEPKRVKPLKVSVKADLTKENWPGSITRHGFNDKDRALFILEGVIMYLDEAEIKQVFDHIRSIMVKGSEIFAHTITEDYLKSEKDKVAREVFKSENAPFKFGTNEPENLFRDYPELKAHRVTRYPDLAVRYESDLTSVSLNSAFVHAALL